MTKSICDTEEFPRARGPQWPYFHTGVRVEYEQVKLNRLRASEAGSTQGVALALTLFVVGIAAGVLLVSTRSHIPAAAAPVISTPGLSSSTVSVLKNLQQPVEVRFYSLLDPASVLPELKAFSTRVEQLLTAMQQAAGGKLTLKTSTDLEADATTAGKDGMRPFNIDKGQACFLGVAVASASGQEKLPLLSPEWDQALEADLARSLQKVGQAPEKPAPAVQPVVSEQMVQEVRQVVPELATLTPDAAAAKIREAALAEYRQAAAIMAKEVREAQEQLQAAQASASESERDAAVQHLRQLQEEHSERLKAIAAKAQSQVDAVKLMKTAAE